MSSWPRRVYCRTISKTDGSGRYMKVNWLHDLAEEPVVLYSEVIDGGETRKVMQPIDLHVANHRLAPR